MKMRFAVVLFALALACVAPLFAQQAQPQQSAQGQQAKPAAQPALDPDDDGLWQGYDGEWDHVSRHLLALAEAIPAEKYSWRPSPGVRSVSEVLMHTAMANFYLLSITGPPMPPDMKRDMEKTMTAKNDVIAFLKRSLAAVKDAHPKVKPAEMQRQVKVFGRDATVDGMYMRIILHDNEHYGQLIAYARSIGVTPPWSK